MLAKRLAHTIEIAAKVDAVWAILTDFANYPNWNPFVPQAEGQLEKGQRIKIRLVMGKRATPVRPVVTRVDRPHELRWLAKWGPSRGWFDVDRGFLLDAMGPNRTRFVQEEICSGVFAPAILAASEGNILAGYRRLAEALKSRAEGPAARVA
jgi:hypothetical protein